MTVKKKEKLTVSRRRDRPGTTRRTDGKDVLSSADLLVLVLRLQPTLDNSIHLTTANTKVCMVYMNTDGAHVPPTLPTCGS